MKRILFLAAVFLLPNLCSAQGGTIHTISGSSSHAYGGDGGPASAALLNGPFGVTADNRGNLYIADYDNNIVRKINASGIISTVAGNRTYGDTGDGGPATAANLAEPHGVGLDTAGNLYIADYYNSLVRKVNTHDTIGTFAGTHGSYGYSGDGSGATSALCWDPIAVIADRAGNVYFSDWSNSVVRKVNSSGIISTVAGTGTAGYNGDSIAATTAQLNQPVGLALDLSGNLLIADCNNHRVRKVTAAGTITTIAGTGTGSFSGDGGPATAAAFNGVFGVALDRDGNIYVADGLNSRIRKIDTARIVTTFAGNGSNGFSGDGSAATAASLYYPSGVATDTAGNVFIADFVNNRIRKVDCILPRVASIMATTSTLCAGAVTTFLDSTLGGTWTATNGHALVSGGLVTGVSGGVDTIVYTVSNYCGAAATRRVITINPLPEAGLVTGTMLICGTGASVTLTDTPAGGAWSVTNTRASITSGGVVTGLVYGLDTVRYIVTNTCGRDTAWTPITISPYPHAGAITGTPAICGIGATTTLSDTVIGGTWSNVNTSVATVSGGLVWGIAFGVDTIKYASTNICGTAVAAIPVTVYAADGGIINGLDTVCAGNDITLTDSIPGGTWTSTTGLVSVSATGRVTGRSAGIDTVRYTITNTCGVFDTFLVVTVLPAEACWPLGITTGTSSAEFLVYPNPSGGTITVELPTPMGERAELTIFDLLGRKALVTAVNTGKPLYTGLPAGTYIVTVTTPQAQHTQRLTIEQ